MMCSFITLNVWTLLFLKAIKNWLQVGYNYDNKWMSKARRLNNIDRQKQLEYQQNRNIRIYWYIFKDLKWSSKDQIEEKEEETLSPWKFLENVTEGTLIGFVWIMCGSMEQELYFSPIGSISTISLAQLYWSTFSILIQGWFLMLFNDILSL